MRYSKNGLWDFLETASVLCMTCFVCVRVVVVLKFMACSNVYLRSGDQEALTVRNSYQKKSVSMVFKLILFSLQFFLYFHVPKCFRTPQSQPIGMCFHRQIQSHSFTLNCKANLAPTAKAVIARRKRFLSGITGQRTEVLKYQVSEAFSVASKPASDTFVSVKLLIRGSQK